ncbi:MAG: DUF2341 domain-containing protein, partial [Candidatus Nealsonbacteria bacterium]|nr:DUF2341 domain-containing protein [Candidatus Nealsonbacteria bacterium]
MESFKIKKKRYLSPKEAGDIFGYNPEYLTFLLRTGRIRGRKIPANSFWQTTVGEVVHYCEEQNREVKNIQFLDAVRNREIDLKEAAAISGYHPDYIGSLLREGRIAGKKIETQSSWQVAREEIKRYKKSTDKHLSERDRTSLLSLPQIKINLSLNRSFALAVFVFLIFSLFSGFQPWNFFQNLFSPTLAREIKSINLYPSSYEHDVSSGDEKWQNSTAIFSQDLEELAGFDEFNQDNSAFPPLIFREISISQPAPFPSEPFSLPEEGEKQEQSTSTEVATSSPEEISDGKITGETSTSTIEDLGKEPVMQEDGELETPDRKATSTAPENDSNEENSPANGEVQVTPLSPIEENQTIKEPEAAPSIQDTQGSDTDQEVETESAPDSNEGAQDNPPVSLEGESPSFFIYLWRKIRHIFRNLATNLYHLVDVDWDYFRDFALNRIFSIFDGRVKAEEINPSTTPVHLEANSIYESGLIVSDFYVPETTQGSQIVNAQLRLSLAGKGEAGDKLVIDYYYLGQWQHLEGIELDKELSNAQNEGYFLYGLPVFDDWQSLRDLKVRFTYVTRQRSGRDSPSLYIDSAWLEISYEEKTQEETVGRELIEKDKKGLVAKMKEFLGLEDKEGGERVLILPDGREIRFDYTDENNGENLIIKSDKRFYNDGLTETEVYFSVTNNSQSSELVNLQVYFPEDKGEVENLESWSDSVLVKKEVPDFGQANYRCEGGWKEVEEELEGLIEQERAATSTGQVPTSTSETISTSSHQVTTSTEENITTTDGEVSTSTNEQFPPSIENPTTTEEFSTSTEMTSTTEETSPATSTEESFASSTQAEDIASSGEGNTSSTSVEPVIEPEQADEATNTTPNTEDTSGNENAPGQQTAEEKINSPASSTSSTEPVSRSESKSFLSRVWEKTEELLTGIFARAKNLVGGMKQEAKAEESVSSTNELFGLSSESENSIAVPSVSYWCSSTKEIKDCDYLSGDKKDCVLEGIQIGFHQEQEFKEGWENLSLSDKPVPLPERSIWDRIFGLGTKREIVPHNFVAKKAVHSNDLGRPLFLKPGETKYFKMKIRFPPRSSGEFYIEAVGSSKGYGILDPWWNSNWFYREPITIDNSTNTNSFTDYQVLVEIGENETDFWDNVRSDGGDVRFLDSSDTTELDHFQLYWNYASSTAKYWVKVDSIPGSSTTSIYIYYGNENATSTSNVESTFSYATRTERFYALGDYDPNSAAQAVTFFDNNSFEIASSVDTDWDTGTSSNPKSIPNASTSEGAAALATKPFAITGTGDSCEMWNPAAWQSKLFVTTFPRDDSNLFFYNPSDTATATVSVYKDGNATGTVVLGPRGYAERKSYGHTDNAHWRIESTEPVLVHQSGGGTNEVHDQVSLPPPAAVWHGIQRNTRVVASEDNTTVSIYWSDGTLATSTLSSTTVWQMTGGGDYGSGPSGKLVADKPVYVLSYADSDGNEMQAWYSDEDLDTEYLVAENLNYIACSAPYASTTITVYDLGGALATTSGNLGNDNAEDYPYHWRDMTDRNGGMRISANNPIYCYYEQGTGDEDEHNTANRVLNRQGAWPRPEVSSFGGQEVKSVVAQNYYRWYVNKDNITPDDPWPFGGTDLNENSAIATNTYAVKKGEILRLRMSVQAQGQPLATSSVDFKLQYGEGLDCTQISQWYDVGNFASSTIWRSYNNTSLVDGESLSSSLLSVSDAAETYEEQNLTASNTQAVAVNDDFELDWSLQNNDAVKGSSYCFRLVKRNGEELYNYNYYPRLLTYDPVLPESWWDNGWASRKQIVVTNPSNSTSTPGYPVAITFDHKALVDSGKSLSSGNDIRIVYWSSSTSSWTELDRKAEGFSATTWNTTNTTVWFDFNATTSPWESDDNYYLYFNNLSAGSPPASFSKANIALNTVGGSNSGEVQTRLQNQLYSVTTQACNADVSSFDGAIAHEDCTSGDFSALKNDTAGIVTNEQSNEEFGFSGTCRAVNTDSIYIATTTHYITKQYSVGTTTILSSTLNNWMEEIYGNDELALAEGSDGSGQASIGACESGDSLYDSTAAAERRAWFLPATENSFNTYLNDDGWNLWDRTIEWISYLDKDNVTYLGTEETPFSVSGTVYSDEGSTPLLTRPVVTLAINGSTTASTTASNVEGSFTISSSQMSTGTSFIVYLDNSTITGATIDRYSGSGNVTGIDIYQNRVIVRHNDSGPITNSDLAVYDGTNDEDVKFIVSGGNLTVSSTETLYIWGGDTFTPGGTVTTQPNSSSTSLGADIKIATSSVFNVQSNNVYCGGDWHNAGSFSPSFGQVTEFTGTDTGFYVKPGSSNFENLTFNGGGGEWELMATNTINSDLLMTTGTLSVTQNITLKVKNGSATGTDGVINFTNGEFIIDGTSDFGADTTWYFYDLTFGNGSGNEATSKTGSGNIEVRNILEITSSHTLQASSQIWDLSGSGTPLVVNGTLTAQSSIFKYTGTSATNITPATYYRLEFAPGSGSPTYTMQAGTLTCNDYLYVGDGTNAVTVTADTNDPTLDIAGDFDIRDEATFVASGSSGFSVGGSWNNEGAFNHSSGTVVFDSSDTGEIINTGGHAEGKKFYNVDFNNASGGWIIQEHGILTENNLDLTALASFSMATTTWWDSGWNYKIPIMVDNESNTNSLSDFQVLVELDETDCFFWENVKSGGDDVRFVSSDETTELDFYELSFSESDQEAEYWVKVDSIPAGDSTNIYLYYGNDTANSSSSAENTLSYATRTARFYALGDYNPNNAALGITFFDNNEFEIAGSVDTDWDTGAAENPKSIPNASTSDAVAAKSTKPFAISITDNVNSGEMWTPAAWQSELFVTTFPRAGTNFAVYNPSSATATVTTYKDGSSSHQDSTFQLVPGGYTEKLYSHTDNAHWRVESTEPVLLFQWANSSNDHINVLPPSTVWHGIERNTRVIASEDNTTVNIYWSDQTSTSTTMSSTTVWQISAGGTFGSGPSGKLVADKPVFVISYADGNGNEMQAWYSDIELDKEYLIPNNYNYLACSAPYDGTTITVYNMDGTQATTTGNLGDNGDNYPHHWLDSTDRTGGQRIYATKPVYCYYDDNDEEDERNMASRVTNRKGAWPRPSTSVGSTHPLVIHVEGQFSNKVGGASTDWASSTLCLWNSGTSYAINTTSTGADIYDNLMVHLDTDIEIWNSVAHSYQIATSGSLYSMDHDEGRDGTGDDGKLFVFGDYHVSSGETDYWSYATDFDGTSLSGGSERQCSVYFATNSTTTVDGGTINIVGDASATTTLANQGSGNYALKITSGTFNANYYQIRDIVSSGLDISGATNVSSLDNGDFLLEINGGSMISVASTTIDNNPSKTITGCKFSTSTGVSSGYNVSRSGNPTSFWKFTGTTGNYDGESFDYDPDGVCGFIRWDDSTCVELELAHYRWRNDDGGEATSTWKANEDTAASGQNQEENIRVRFSVKNPGGSASDSYNYRLQVAELGDYDNCTSVPSLDFSDVPTSLGFNDFQMEIQKFTDIGTSWTTKEFENTYDSPVVIVTAEPNSSWTEDDPPFGVNVRGVSSDQVQVRITLPDRQFGSGTMPATNTVYMMVIEEGYWDSSNSYLPVKMEAVKATSSGVVGSAYTEIATNTTAVNLDSRWASTSHHYFANASIDNEDAWIDVGIWGTSAAGDSPNATQTSNILVGLSSAECDPQDDHATETIHFVTVEEGTFSFDGQSFRSFRTADTIQQHSHDNLEDHNFGTAPAWGVTDLVGMDGADGAWCNWEEAPFTSTQVEPYVQEDRYSDVPTEETAHTDEEVDVFISATSSWSYSEKDVTKSAVMATSSYFTDGASTTNQLTAEGSWATGTMIEYPSNQSSAFVLGGGEYTELEYNFQFTEYAFGTYCFRVNHNNIDLGEYSQVAEISLQGIDVSGYAYEDEGSTVWSGCNGTTSNISLVIDGDFVASTTCSATSGAYIFSSVTVRADESVSVFFNTNGGNTDQGAAVTVAANTYDNISMNVRKSRLWLRTEPGVDSISNASLDHCDSGSPAQCSNVPYSVSGDDLTVEPSTKLIIQSGKSFVPGGSVTLSPGATSTQPGGDVLISSGATFGVATNSVSVGGDWVNNGDFSKSADQVTTFTATSTGFSITPGSANFEDIVFNGSGGGWQFSEAAEIDSDLTVTAGTLSGTQDLTLNGNLSGSGSINLTGGTLLFKGSSNDFGGTGNWTFYHLTFGDGTSGSVSSQGSGTATVDGNLTIASNYTLGGNKSFVANGDVGGDGTINLTGGTFTADGDNSFGGATSWTFYNLTFGDGSGTETTSKTGNNNISVSHGLTISSSHTLQASSQIWTLAGSGTPLVVNGTLEAQSSVFKYTGTSNTNIAPTTYYRLEFAPGSGSPTYSIQAGTLTTNEHIYIGDGTNAVTVNANNYDPTLDIIGDFEIRNNATFVGSASAGLSVAGNWKNYGTFTHSNGTVVFDATDSKLIDTDGTGPGKRFYNIDFNNASGSWEVSTYGLFAEGNLNLTSVSSFEIASSTTDWWDSGWSYKIPMTIDNTSNDHSLTDHQVLLEIDETDFHFWNHIKSGGDDVRFVASDDSTPLDFYELYLSETDQEAKYWVKIDSVPTTSTTQIYLYYGNDSANSSSSAENTFSYATRTERFYSLGAYNTTNSAAAVTFFDNNNFEVGGLTDTDWDTGSADNPKAISNTYTGQGEEAQSTKPFAITGTGDSCEMWNPAAWQSKLFVTTFPRDDSNLFFYNPSDTATSTVSVYKDGNATGTVILGPRGYAERTSYGHTDNAHWRIESTEPILVHQAGGGTGDVNDQVSLTPPATVLHGIRQNTRVVASEDNTEISIYWSDGTISTTTMSSTTVWQVGGGSGQGGAPAGRIVSDKPVYALSYGDGDGGEMQVWYADEDLDVEYLVPEDLEYLACSAPYANTVISVYDMAGSQATTSGDLGSSNAEGYPYHWLDSSNRSGGVRISASKPVYCYYDQLTGEDDEHNIANRTINRKGTWPRPTTSLGSPKTEGTLIVTVQGQLGNGVGGSSTLWNDSILFLDSGTTYTVNTSSTGADIYPTLRVGTTTQVRMWSSSANTFEVQGALYSMDHDEGRDGAGDDGKLFIWGDYQIDTGETEYWSYATDFDGTSLLGGSERQCNVRFATNSTTTVDGGVLNIIGTSSATTTLANQGSGNYALKVEGGTLDADYYQIRDINSQGLDMSGIPAIFSLDNGDFLLEENGGSMISLTSNVVDANSLKTITGCKFSTSTGVSSGYNVSMTGIGSSYWSFTGTSGNYDGEDYDSDSGDPGEIRWDDSATGITVSGNVYSDEGTTPIGTTEIIHLTVNGSNHATTTCSSSTGAYSFGSVPLIGDTIITVYIDDSVNNKKAVTVTRAPTINITDLDLYQDRVIVRHEDPNALDIEDMTAYDSTDDPDILFTASTGTPDTLTVDREAQLYVWPDMTFAPGGNVTLQSGGSG